MVATIGTPAVTPCGVRVFGTYANKPGPGAATRLSLRWQEPARPLDDTQCPTDACSPGVVRLNRPREPAALGRLTDPNQMSRHSMHSSPVPARSLSNCATRRPAPPPGPRAPLPACARSCVGAVCTGEMGATRGATRMQRISLAGVLRAKRSSFLFQGPRVPAIQYGVRLSDLKQFRRFAAAVLCGPKSESRPSRQ